MVELVQRWPATSSSRTFSEPISISSARSFRITALAIASRPTAIAPTAVTARARGPIADGPRRRAPTAIAPVTLAGVAMGPLLWRRMLMILDMVPPVGSAGRSSQPLRVLAHVRNPPVNDDELPVAGRRRRAPPSTSDIGVLEPSPSRGADHRAELPPERRHRA